jgi:hypothetical protein
MRVHRSRLPRADAGPTLSCQRARPSEPFRARVPTHTSGRASCASARVHAPLASAPWIARSAPRRRVAGHAATPPHACAFSPGTLSPGTLSPGTLSPGTLSPGTLSPGTLSPQSSSGKGGTGPRTSRASSNRSDLFSIALRIRAKERRSPDFASMRYSAVI